MKQSRSRGTNIKDHASNMTLGYTISYYEKGRIKMKMIMFALIAFSFISFNISANAESKTADNTNNLSSHTNDELIASIKSDTYNIGEKCKILSKRYYGKAKTAADEGKAELSKNYNSCAEAFKEMSDGFEQNKTGLVKKGKENYKKAVAKMKKISNNFLNNIDLN